MKLILRVMTLTLLIISINFGRQPGAVAEPQIESRYFPETKHEIKGAFLVYWNNHGGLAQQGYPISDEFQEISSTDGRRYLVQYFERSVLERHPENHPPYDVMPSLLGSQQYNRRYGLAGAPGQVIDQDNALFFPQTQHTTRGKFRAYWETHGGLAQQGYPISDEFLEKSSFNGQIYTVQYFERAEFEYHPENKPPYDMLLSQLGTNQYNVNYGSLGDSIPAPQPKAIADTVVGKPVAAGNYIFWSDVRNPDHPRSSAFSIYGYDLVQQREFLISDEEVDKFDLATNGSLLLWAEDGPGDIGSIWAFDSHTNKTYPIIQAIVPEEFGNLALDGTVLYFTDNTIGSNQSRNGFYYKDLKSGASGLVRSTGRDPVAANGLLLYSELIQHTDENISSSEWRLHLWKLGATTQDTVIADQSDPFNGFHVSTEGVVYAVAPGQTDGSLSLYDSANGKTSVLSRGYAANPLIGGNSVIWSTSASSDGAGSVVNLYDLTTGRSVTILNQAVGHIEAMALIGTYQKTLVYVASTDPARVATTLYLLPMP